MIVEILAAAMTVFAILEAGSRYLAQNPDYDCRQADGYRVDGNDWAARYFREWRRVQIKFRWEPFCYWRSAPWRGSYINVDASGLRRTTCASTADKSKIAASPKVFLFGGSTMWGAGVRDTGTIPSHCAAILAQHNRHATVTNYGQLGYVSTQSVVTLLRLLQDGNIPDVVVFYDGYNDVMSSLVNGFAGAAFHEKRRQTEFNILHRTMGLLLGSLRSLHVYGLATSLGKRRVPPAHNEAVLAEEITRYYLANIAVVQALGHSFGFETHFYWQPTIFHKPVLTEFERIQRDKIAAFERTFNLVEGRILAACEKPGIGPKVLSHIFQNEKRSIFLDWAHLTESANRQIAERIATDIEASLDRLSDQSATHSRRSSISPAEQQTGP